MSMVFVLISFIVPSVIFVLLPSALKWLFGKRPRRDILLLVACALYAISWYLPSPLINGINTQFTTHFLGGGVFCGLMWLYVTRSLNWKGAWWLEALSLYATVCVLGVTNELLEFTLLHLHLTSLTGADTWWDLVANTLGAAVFWVIYMAYRYIKNTTRA